MSLLTYQILLLGQRGDHHFGHPALCAVLLIRIEWNLDCDRLDQQSDACLRTVAAFLR